MVSVTPISIAWELRQAGQPVAYIASRVGVHRSTVYRWLKGIRQWGIQGFLRHYRNAKKGRRRRKTHGHIAQRVLAIRRQHHECCGTKIVYWMAKEGIEISRSTVYRILNQHLQLRPKSRRNKRRGAVPQATGPRQVIQMDTIDFGDIYAYTAIGTYTREGQVVLRPSLTSRDGASALKSVMRYFGGCQLLQTDGGSEFEGEFLAMVPRYAGRHRVARPYRKNEQAYIERFNRTVRHECLGWTKYRARQIPELQAHVEQWLDYYHFVRPSMAFETLQTPMEFLLALDESGLSHLT
jgi:transposase